MSDSKYNIKLYTYTEQAERGQDEGRKKERYGPRTQRLPGSVVGIAAGYGLDGPGIESRWE